MRLVILYHPKSDHGGKVEDYAAEFKRRLGRDIELVSLETQAGAEQARLYGITSYPAILALQEDGQLRQAWQGDVLPLMDEVSAYNW